MNEPTLLLGVLDIVGQDGDASGFIAHTGLAQSPGPHDAATVPVLDMVPPLHGQDRPGHMTANVVGSAALTDDEVRKIRTFVDRHVNEHLTFRQFSQSQLIEAAERMYCIHPHKCPFHEDDGRYARMRFSCAGFVFESYKKARITLLNMNCVPVVDLMAIKLAYPQQSRVVERGRTSWENLGLKGSGPWPVLFCGYLLHALNRDPDIIRHEQYSPTLADRHFK